VVALAATGCDDASKATGSGGAASSAGAGDAAAGTGGLDEAGAGGAGGGAEPTRRGSMFLHRSWYASADEDPDIADDGGFLAELYGVAREEPDVGDEGCTHEVIEGCRVSICDRSQAPTGEPVPLVTAGTIEVEGLAVPLVATPGGHVENGYEVELPHADDVGWPFASGAAISLHAAGDAVPAFTAATHAPARLRVTSPVLDDQLVIDREVPLDFEWTAGPGEGRMAVIVDDMYQLDGKDDMEVSVQCEADVGDGGLRIPAAALAELDVQSGAALFVISHSATEVDAGDWRVFVGVSDYTYLYGSVEIQ
jgi:hypothetical protein